MGTAYLGGAWRDLAACGGDPTWLDQPVRWQLQQCETCPVVADCLAFGRETYAAGVVYGGVLFPDPGRRKAKP